MSTHTPGPWYQCGDEVMIDMGDRSHLIATVADWSEDTESYTRLIAAAPDLLEELRAVEQHLHAYVEAIEYGGGSASKSSERLSYVRAAIAKATEAA